MTSQSLERKVPSASSACFLPGKDIPAERVGEGVLRQVMGYDPSILLARVLFEAGGVGEIHDHPHSQVTYIESGEFEVYIGGETRLLSAGDGFYIPPNTSHGAVCKKAGALIDVFSPVREDFLDEGDEASPAGRE